MQHIRGTQLRHQYVVRAFARVVWRCLPYNLPFLTVIRSFRF